MNRVRTHKVKWRSIGVPDTLVKKIRELIKKTGDTSISEYVRVAIRQRIEYDEEHQETEEKENHGWRFTE